jgi:hypothetical protein
LSTLESEIREAEASAREVLSLSQLIVRLPTENRRRLVFQALALAESPTPVASRSAPSAAKGVSAPSAGATPAERPAFPTHRGARRPEKVLKAQAEALLAEVRRGGGRGIEELASALGTTTHTLALPMINLLKEGRVKKTGRLRGTRYTASRGQAPASQNAPSAEGAPAAGGKRPSRGRGSSLDAATVLREVRREGGRGVEALAKSLGVKTKQVQLPLRKLIEAKAIKTKGERRGMRYTAK